MHPFFIQPSILHPTLHLCTTLNLLQANSVIIGLVRGEHTPHGYPTNCHTVEGYQMGGSCSRMLWLVLQPGAERQKWPKNAPQKWPKVAKKNPTMEKKSLCGQFFPWTPGPPRHCSLGLGARAATSPLLSSATARFFTTWSAIACRRRPWRYPRAAKEEAMATTTSLG